jgi:ankyrin repeat protein
LFVVLQNRYIEVVKLLLKKDTDIAVADNNKVTLLIQALSKGYIEIVKLLLEKGTDITAADNKG